MGSTLISLGLYALGAILLLVYGIEVCPYIEDLNASSAWHLSAIIFGSTLFCWSARFFIVQSVSQESLLHAGKALRINIGLWMVNGAIITKINFFLHEIPLDSGAKIMVGCFTVGVLISAILSLLHGGQCIEDAIRTKSFSAENHRRFFSMTRKFAIFSTLCLVQFAVIVLLLIYKDLEFLQEHLGGLLTDEHQSVLFNAILLESAFVLGVLLSGSVAVFWLYSRNTAKVYRYINETLQEVEKGDFSKEIPIASSDEFSQISLTANKMIKGLREKERIRNIFGKYVSPDVANEILTQSDGGLLEGKAVNAAILFSDIRSFTKVSEGRPPKEIVKILNIYFSHFVKVIHDNGGVLDKFIGDAVLAVFTEGLDKTPCESAVRAALAMREQLHLINKELAFSGLPTIDNGTGIHYGEVISGNIGSPERLEYTVIGDTVNTAARIESATKEEGCPVLISKGVFERLSEFTQARFQTLGVRVLKGKEQDIEIFHVAS